MQAASHYGCVLPTPNDNDFPHFHAQWLDEIGDDMIAIIDRLEAHGDLKEVREFGFSALSRTEQALILESLELNLQPTKTIQPHAPSSYSIKHACEDMLHDTVPYVSDLQARTALHIAGYRHTQDRDYPRFNISLKAWRRYKESADRKRWGEPDYRAISIEDRLFANAAVV